MSKQIQTILKFSTTFLLIILAGICICYVLEIFKGDEARELAVKTIKIGGILAVSSILMMYISSFGTRGE